jgi:hypothetical protein
MKHRSALVGLSLLLCASGARAQAPTQARAAAEALFRQAVVLAKAGNLNEACPKFEESQRLDPQTGTLVYMATCHAEQGKTATAWVEFNRAATLAARAGETERAETAKSRARELEPKLSRIKIELQAHVQGMKIALDGNELETPSLDTLIPVDPGKHELSASAPGYQSRSTAFTVSQASGVASVVVPALVEQPAVPTSTAKPAAAPPVAPHDAPPPATHDTSRGGTTLRTLGWIGVGVGAIGVGVGSYFGLRAMSTRNDANGHCKGSYCDPTGLEKHDDSHLQATVSTIAFGVGLAAAGAGVVLLLSSKSKTENGALLLETRPSGGGGEISLTRVW